MRALFLPLILVDGTAINFHLVIQATSEYLQFISQAQGIEPMTSLL